MKDKKDGPKISAFVGILGGPLALFPIVVICGWTAPVVRGQCCRRISDDILELFFVALKSAHYYKADKQCESGDCKSVCSLKRCRFRYKLTDWVGKCSGVSEVLDWIMFAVFDDGFERDASHANVSIIDFIHVWGIYYAICLRKFKSWTKERCKMEGIYGRYDVPYVGIKESAC